MKFLFLLALFLYGGLQITAESPLIRGKKTKGDEVMFFLQKTGTGSDRLSSHQYEYRIPGEGETEFHNITYISIINLYPQFEIKNFIVDGGVGESFVTLYAGYPDGNPANVKFEVRGIYNHDAPCKRK